MVLSLWIYCLFGILEIAYGINRCSKDVSTCTGTRFFQDIYFDVTDSCYFDFAINSTYNDAKSTCEGIGAHLLTIESEEEQSFVVSKLLIQKSGRWLALEKIDNQWVWSYNNIHKNLAFDILKDSNIQNNLRAFTQYKIWQAESEEALHTFVCEFDMKPEPKTQTARYEHYRNNILYFSFIKSGSLIPNPILCGNFCLQTACCSVYMFNSVNSQCNLYRRDPTSPTEITCVEKHLTCYMKSVD